MDQIRFGVVGTGMMGCEHLRNLAALPDAVVTAYSDPHETSREWARLTLGDAAERVAAFTDHRALLDSGLVDAVVVASPNMTHAAVLRDALATDVAVLVEKPMCTTVEDCEAVVDAARARRALTWVGLEYRYMPPVAALLAQLRADAIGRLRMLAIREHRFPFLPKVDDWNRFDENTGGTLVEKCCHFFDLMNLAARVADAGARPVRVLASGGQALNHLDERYDGRVPDILDHAYVIVEYSNDLRANLDLCMFAEAGRNEQELVAVGERGKVEAFVPGAGHLYVGERATRSVRKVEVTTDADVGHVGFHHGASYLELAAFCAALRTGAAPEVGVDDGLWSVAVGVAAHRAIATGRAVTLAEVLEPPAVN